jgi:mono/diheme cytochrome c family protein
LPIVETLSAHGGARVLIFEMLAERTLALAQLERRKNPELGYAPLLAAMVRPVLRRCLENNIAIVSNFGAAHPQAAAQLIRQIANDGVEDISLVSRYRTGSVSDLSIQTAKGGKPACRLDATFGCLNAQVAHAPRSVPLRRFAVCCRQIPFRRKHMTKRFSRFVLLLGAFCAMALVRVSQQPSVVVQAVSQADARAVVQKVCGTCHALDRVTSTRRSPEQWEEVTNKMISMGAKGSEEEIAAVIKYLATNYGREAADPSKRPAGGRRVGVLGAGANDKHMVDDAAADRGRSVWAAQCINCHGTTARGTDKGANLVRSDMAWSDRYGSDFWPLLQKGHPLQSGAASTTLTRAQVEDLSHFIHQQLYETLRGSKLMDVKNILTGNVQDGAAFFNGAGKCSTCHSITGDLAGIGKRYNPVTLQQRFVFPRVAREKLQATVTPANGAAVTGVLTHIDDFNVSLRDGQGQYHSWKRTPSLKITRAEPLAAHVALLDTMTDKNMHDIVAYLETLK